MVEFFDDGKLASEQRFSQMAKNYAGVVAEKNVVNMLSGEVEDNVDLLSLALNIEVVGELLKRITNLSQDFNLRQFYQKLYDINEIELNELVSLFNITAFKTHNPTKNSCLLNNLLKLKMQTIYYEMKNIELMLDALKKRLSSEKQSWLNNAIARRLKMVELILE